jgi:multicomponent Na+:H+ antiporter subunit E
MRELKDLFTVFLLFASWVIISGRFSVYNLILGAVISTLVVFIIHSAFTREIAQKVINRTAIYYVIYVAVKVFIASYKLAYLVLSPKASFEPGIVKVPTELGKKNRLIKLTILANTITLTPGTITIDTDATHDQLYVHWIDVKTDDVEKTREIIVGDFEPLIRRIFK